MSINISTLKKGNYSLNLLKKAKYQEIKVELKDSIIFWLIGVSILAIAEFLPQTPSSNNQSQFLLFIFVPLLWGVLLYMITDHESHLTPILLFFSISITTIFGLSEPLTGSQTKSNFSLFYGLSFYSASLAYLIKSRKITQSTPLNISNPLILVTGPLAIFIKNYKYRKFYSRVDYYLPYVVLGFFLHQAIATPLIKTFHLINATDAVTSITFAAIFELFVYANFCGLSLIIFGAAGIFGYKIPLNFRQPFSSTNIVDFWKGWHVSLSLVLKSLFYTPVRKRFNRNAAIFAVFFSSAMWHGITFNFFLWGSFHAIMFVVSLLLLKNNIRILPTLLFIFSVIFGRLLFADSHTHRLIQKLSFDYLGLEGVMGLSALPLTTILAIILISLFILAEFAFQKTRLFKSKNYKFYRLPIVQFVLLLLTLMTISNDMGVGYAVYGQR